VDVADIVGSLGFPASLLDAAHDPSWDPLIRAETDEALRRTERWCTRPWTQANPRPATETSPEPSAAQLHMCPVEGSALLVVGRFVSSEAAGTWQVSVAVIDAS